VNLLRLLIALPRQRMAAVSVVAGAATILASVGLVSTSGYLISRAAERPPILDLMLVIVAVRFFGLARPVLRYGERLVSHDVTFRMLRQVRRWFYDALVPLAPARLMTFRSGDLLARLAGDVDSLQELHLRLIAPATVALIVSSIVVCALLLFVDATLALVVLILLAANGAVWPLLSRRLARGAGVRRTRERSAMSRRLVSFLQGLEDLQAFGRDGDELKRLLAHQRVLDTAERQEGAAGALHAAAGGLLTQLGLWTALALTVPLALDGNLPGAWVAATSLGVLAAFEAVEAMPAAWQRHAQIDEAAGRVFEVIDAKPAVVDAAAQSGARAWRAEAVRPLPLPLATSVAAAVAGALAPVALALRVSGVTFAYDGDAADAALREVSFDVAPGEHVALVGASGSGKSTLLSLLVRAWDPAAGRIELDGRALPDIALAELRASVALMPQQVYVFDNSLRENVRLARPSATDADVRDALRTARLGGFLASLPRGLDTRLGEHGSRMSAGERQRLGLARLLLSTAQIVLADEPTANLDPEQARDVIAALRACAGARPLLLATHRLDDLDTMDRILVFDRGRLAEQGTHAALLSQDGLYTRLVNTRRDLLRA
jgi:ATP-binding cassette subfamily C protein CydC